VSIRSRSMQPDDAEECARIVAQHPVLAARYAEEIQHLDRAWRAMFGSDAFVATVFEETENSKTEILGAGVAAFVTDEFADQLKSEPSFWIGPEFTARIARGKSPVLTNKQLREANSSSGLNLAVWQTAVLPHNLVRLEVGGLIMAAFVEAFRGFLLKESLTQAETVEHVEALRLTGGLLWNTQARSYQDFSGVLPLDLLNKPHVIGMSRDLASRAPGSWAASMFLYEKPRFGFNRSEQRLLLAALDGGTDQELSHELSISPETIKKAWRRIYGRAAACLPEPALGNSAVEEGTAERGKEKKQRLLAYLRDHPEELRPISRRLL